MVLIVTLCFMQSAIVGQCEGPGDRGLFPGQVIPKT